MSPEPYPRIPHLAPDAVATRDDLVLDDAARRRLLGTPLRVEEKLDGANVMLWLDEHGVVQVATRGGPGAIDRAGQLGPLKAWAAERQGPLTGLLRDGRTLYGEWLWLRHGVAYDALPDLLVGIDIREGNGRFLPVDERDDELVTAGVIGPPVLTTGPLETVQEVDALLGRSRFAAEAPAEGLILRAPGEERLVAKRVASAHERRTDAAWRANRERNVVVGAR